MVRLLRYIKHSYLAVVNGVDMDIQRSISYDEALEAWLDTGRER